MSGRHRGIILGAGAGVLLLAVAVVVLWNRPESGAGKEDMRKVSDGAEVGTAGSETPDMDMGDMSGTGTIRLSAEALGSFGITFGTVDVRPLVRTIRAVGIVEFDETRMAYVAPKFGGWVERLHVDFTGQPVRRGQALLEVYSPELVTAQEELLLAARMADEVGGSRVGDVAAGSRDLLEPARRRLRYWDISDAQIERLLETGEVRKTLTLYAPVSGIVMEKDVFEGQAYQPGKNLYMIADLSEVWVNAEVFDADAGLISNGTPAEITVAALPGRTLSGRVEYVYPTLEDRTRSMRARIALANPGGQLKPGMYATVRFRVDLGERLTVPTTAVLHSGERAIAFADMGGGELMPHEVELGVRGRDFAEVVSGLEPGQRVVTSAQFLLDSESNLAEVIRAMMVQMNLSDMDDMDDMDMGGQEMAPPRPDTVGGR